VSEKLPSLIQNRYRFFKIALLAMAGAVSAAFVHARKPFLINPCRDPAIVAHCASLGEDEDLDRPGTRQESFDLFARLMNQSEWKENLFGDISAIVFRNRKPEIIRTLLTRDDWHGRLLNGSDYPLPGILPLTSLSRLVRHGLLPKEPVADLRALREANALHFDLALKRSLNWQGKSFPARVFETRTFFETA